MNSVLWKHRYTPQALEKIREGEEAKIPAPVCQSYERPDKQDLIAAFEARMALSYSAKD